LPQTRCGQTPNSVKGEVGEGGGFGGVGVRVQKSPGGREVNSVGVKGGVRTAFHLCPVRVCLKRGAEAPETRLRGVSFLSPARHTHSPPSPDLPTLSPLTVPRQLQPQNPRFPPLKPSPSNFLAGLDGFFDPFSSVFRRFGVVLWGRDAQKGRRCVCLAGVKKKEKVNRDCPVSAPRFTSARFAFGSNAVRREGKGGLSLGWARGVWRR